MVQKTEANSQFECEVINGLQAKNKFLSSKYFYDSRGDDLFRQIMELDEYYLTKRELDIFETQKEEILNTISDGTPFRIIELGPGDGFKTKVLLSHFQRHSCNFTYTPVDISTNVLDILQRNLLKEIPELKIESFAGDYFDALKNVASTPEKDVIFFLGSNIGNFPGEDAIGFLSKLRGFLKPGDLLLMGVDMKKDPSIIIKAYNDSKGITREFNLNLIDRINTELNGNLDRNAFMHYPYYNPQTGECRSYLISTKRQEATISGQPIVLEKWESIFMEISKKYDVSNLDDLCEKAGFNFLKRFSDTEDWFSNVVWENPG